MKIGVIGNGFVGKTMAFAFSPNSTGDSEVFVYDKNPALSLNSLEEAVNDVSFVFVCVPTPMDSEGRIVLKYVESVFNEVNEVLNNDPIFIIKSTVIPGTTKNLQEKHENNEIIFSPEFLTERSARLDVLTQNSAILGGSKTNTKQVRKLYESRFHGLQIIETDSTTAEFVKYLSNVFFASKVSFMNEMKLVADKVGVDWETAVHGLVSNGRVANTHLQVPGPDGKLGFGGTCFAKDICSFMNFAEDLGVDLNVVKGAWKTNIAVREEKDWEEKRGRAVE